MRFIFLDFDGVLNSHDWLKRRPSKIEWAAQMDISPEEFTHNHVEWALRSIDPDAVLALNRLVTMTGARVVVSSTWRTMYPLPKLNRMLRYLGFEHLLLGTTPEGMSARLPGGIVHGTRRGEEIKAWLTAMFGSWSPPDVSIVILDDDSDMAELVPRLFRTPHEVGLRDADVETIAAMFEVT